MKITSLLGMAACAVLLPATSAAQTCLGVPTRDGQSAVALQGGFVENAKLYGAEASIHLPSRIVLVGKFQVAAFDEERVPVEFGGYRQIDGYSATTVGGALAFGAVDAPSFGLCPVAGFEFSSWHSNSELAVPVGIGIGATVGSEFRTTFYGVPQFLWLNRWHEVQVFEDGASGSESDSETTFGAQTGINFSQGRFFGGGSVFTTLLDDYDPRFVLQFGMFFGGH